MSAAPPLGEALQAALRGEHAAVYGYGVLGPWLAPADRPTARAALDAHRARRDRLAALAQAEGAAPEPAAPAYDVSPPTNPASARRLAALLEDRLAAVYADLVAAGEGGTRTLAGSALQEAAVRAARWRGATVAFPGLPERA